MTTPTLDSVNADLQTFKTQVPTLEEQITTTFLDSWPNSSGTPITHIPWSYRATLLVAPFPLKMLSLAASFEYWNFAASDTAYWQAAAEKGNQAAGFTTLATRTTQSTGANAGGGITQRTAWTFDAAPWADASMAAGDLFAVSWTPIGGPAYQVMPITYTMRYRRL